MDFLKFDENLHFLENHANQTHKWFWKKILNTIPLHGTKYMTVKKTISDNDILFVLNLAMVLGKIIKTFLSTELQIIEFKWIKETFKPTVHDFKIVTKGIISVHHRLFIFVKYLWTTCGVFWADTYWCNSYFFFF